MAEKQIMYNYTGDDHRRRLLNLRYIEKNLDSCGKKNFVTDYRPGHYVYKKNAPQTEAEDRELFKMLSDAGVEILQLWSGFCGFNWGGDVMYRPTEPEKAREFIKLAHEYGLKVLPYTSTNFFTRQDESFNPDWAFIEDYDLHMRNHKFTLAHCSPTSPLWREHLLKQFTGLLDEYDFDGLYIDSGYIRRRDFMTFDRYYFREPELVKDDVLAFEESESFDGGMQDLLALIYSEVKKRGGILKFHKEGQDTVYTDLKVYDYLWVGEANKDIDFIRDSVRDFRPYVTPDYNYEIEDEHDKPEMIEKQVSEREYVFSCRLDVKYLNERYALNIEESEEYDTLAGYIIYNYDGLPNAGEVVEIENLRIKVLRTTRSRLELARVEILQKKT